MNISLDLHTHTTYCDGKDTPEQMVRAAIALDMECLGFSGHGYAPYDTDCCMTRQGALAYRAEIAALKEKYAGRIRLLCGVEQDCWSGESTEGYDYVIGSVHYLKQDGRMFSVDDTAEIARRGVEACFGGDWYACAEAYFAAVAEVVERTDCDIIGHFDLVSKFNQRERFFDERHPRYAAAWKKALDRLLPYGRVFEINTGAVSRGWRSVPYPAPGMIDYIRDRGGRLIFSSDSHSASTLLSGFSDHEEWGGCLIRTWSDGLFRR